MFLLSEHHHHLYEIPGRNFEQGDLNIKRTILHQTAQQVELNTGTKESKNI